MRGKNALVEPATICCFLSILLLACSSRWRHSCCVLFMLFVFLSPSHYWKRLALGLLFVLDLPAACCYRYDRRHCFCGQRGAEQIGLILLSVKYTNHRALSVATGKSLLTRQKASCDQRRERGRHAYNTTIHILLLWAFCVSCVSVGSSLCLCEHERSYDARRIRKA